MAFLRKGMTEDYQNMALRKTKNDGYPPPGHKGIDSLCRMWLFLPAGSTE
jgi:hypothetical protein